MTLYPSIKARILQRFEKLIEEASEIIEAMRKDNEIEQRKQQNSSVIYAGEINHQSVIYYEFVTKVTSLIELTLSDKHFSSRAKKIIEKIDKGSSVSYHVKEILGILRGLKSDFESGMLENLSNIIEGNIVADYMGQAEQLLGEGVSGHFDHVPAAVLAGAVLEDALRRICQRQNPPIELIKPKGGKKTLNNLIDDLKAINFYTELKAKQLRSWAGIRNAAAHGEFQEFNRGEVERMIQGIQEFLADHL